MEQEPMDRGRDAAVLLAERARAAGDPAEAARIAREALAAHGSPAAAVALALALVDLGDGPGARRTLETLLESLGEGGSALARGEAVDAPAASFGVIPDTTLAAATAATLELVGSLDDAGLDTSFDDAGFEQAFEEAEVERELLHHADVVAEQVLDALPPEPTDEILPPAGSPFATRTFADLLERQGHEAEAETLRSSLDGREAPDGREEVGASPDGTDPRARVVATLERWLENLGRTAA